MRPVFDRLPEKGYQDNQAVSALLVPFEERLGLVADTMANFWRRLTLEDSAAKDLTGYVPVPSNNLQVAGHTLEVPTPMVYTLGVAYPPPDQGLPHFIRVLDSRKGTVWERSVAGKAWHYYTNIVLPPGSYTITTNYYKGLPLTSGEGTVSVFSGSTTAAISTVPNSQLPLWFAPQTDAERQQSEALDYVAYLLGLTGKFWSRGWDDGVKQNLIRNAGDIQQWRGTERGLRLVLDGQEISYDIWGSNPALRLSFALSSGVNTTATRFGSAQPNVFVRLPLTADRRSREYTETQRAVSNYTASASSIQVCYSAFHLGYSAVGEPVFNQ